MDQLLKSVKADLRITYEYLDDHLTELIKEGMDVINTTCGVSDYTQPGLEQKLLKAYCRYSFNNASQLFEDNYRHDLLKLQIKNGRGVSNG